MSGPVIRHYEPHFIATSIPYLLSREGGCLYSSPHQLLIVLLIGLAAIIVADIAKPLARSASASFAILGFQLILFFDVLRAYGGEWWTYFAAILGVSPDPALSGGLPRPPISSVPWPWIGGVAGLCVSSYLLAIKASQERQRQSDVADQR